MVIALVCLRRESGLDPGSGQTVRMLTQHCEIEYELKSIVNSDYKYWNLPEFPHIPI